MWVKVPIPNWERRIRVDFANAVTLQPVGDDTGEVMARKEAKEMEEALAGLFEKEINSLQRIKDRWHHVTLRPPSDPFYERAVEEDEALTKAIEILTIHGEAARLARILDHWAKTGELKDER